MILYELLLIVLLCVNYIKNVIYFSNLFESTKFNFLLSNDELTVKPTIT